MLGTSLSMLGVQCSLINADKTKYLKLFFGSSLAWLMVFLGAINTLREFSMNASLREFVTQLCEIFSSIDNMLLLWLGMLIVALVVYWPKVVSSYTLPNNTRIVVECCDLLKQRGLKVIQSTETFDTVVGGVIKPNSVHGSFLSLCEKKGFDVDKAIARQFNEDENTREKHVKQPIGTVCPIRIEDEPFCFIAFTHWDDDERNITLTEDEYLDFLRMMWENLGQSNVKNDVVNVAVLGNANLKQTKMYTTEQRIADMIKTFLKNNSDCCKTLHICVHTSNAFEIDFNNYSSIIRFLYNSVELEKALSAKN